jgi:hypothetical protein
MDDSDRPEGELFSRLYIEREAPERDSKRMRKRLATLVRRFKPEGMIDLIEGKLGIDVPVGWESIQWEVYFEQNAPRDVLDTITLVCRALAVGDRRRGWGNDADKFVAAANTIFREENLSYEVDAKGGVHLYVDKDFERNSASVILGLSKPRYGNVVSNLDDAHTRLTGVEPDSRAAVRATFDAAEALFKLMFPREPRLTAKGASSNLRPIAQRMTEGNPPAAAASAKALDSLCEWVEACQNYRHEHGQPEVIEPPRWLAVLLVSTGASHIRWLAEIDAWMLAHS